jgi:heat shock protein 4
MAAKAAVIGIDIGSDSSLVAYVGKGVVDVVQNEVSKRNTASLVGFTQRERLLGDAALAQIKSNAKNSCRNFKHLLGQQENAAMVEKEKFWSTCPLAPAADGNCGYDISYKGEQRAFSAPQVTAMFLTKLKEITEKWVQAKLADVVIGVPSYFSDVHRQALLDAAKIANISVLRLMNEHTATALAYGIYRSNDFDAEKPCNVAFCSMGHSMFSVSVVEFCKGRLRTICEESDKVGGRDMNECLIREFSAQFEKKFGCNPLSNKKAIIKLEDSVEKCKKILSANAEAGLNCECLMEDNDFSSNMTRDLFEKMCEPMMDKVKGVLDRAIGRCGLSPSQIDFVEVVGGASRVPWVKRMCSEAFGGKELSTTMNADESVARGCALQAAMLSPLYKVREFKVEDSSPLGISIGWMGSAADSEAGPQEDGDINMAGGEGEFKTAVVYPAGSAMNTLKMLTFYRKGPFELKADYVDPALLIPGTNSSLGSYKIDLPASADVKKIKVKAKLTIHGTFCVEGAQMIEDEEYEETIKEKRELPPDPAAEAPPAAEGDAAPPPPEGTDAPMAEGEEKKEGESASPKKEAKPPEKKYEWVEVKKNEEAHKED